MGRQGLRTERTAFSDWHSRVLKPSQWTSRFSKIEEHKKWSKTWPWSLVTKFLVSMVLSFQNLLIVKKTNSTGPCSSLSTSHQDVKVSTSSNSKTNTGPIEIWSYCLMQLETHQLWTLQKSIILRNRSSASLIRSLKRTTGKIPTRLETPILSKDGKQM